MFEIAWSELLIVAIVAILVVGPKELPALLRTVGRMVGKLRRSADEFRKHFDDAVREAGAEDLQREMQALRHHNPLSQIRDTIEEASRDINSSVNSIAGPAATPSTPAIPERDPFNDDLPPPPPLPPRSDTATSPAAATPAQPQPKPAEQPAAAPAAKELNGNGVDHEVRANGEHRPTS
ncbi:MULTISPECIES: Sec-independent protein translocase protein TatB [Rhodomicrobium]|uniref:Sec-independent protein translocase protein TatB n=1 Tax=Rhodomicrobium TaxID=1068 RepID=UPI000B4ACFDE|nr:MULTISPECIES: Sec-independent protein translocase protein TatB [Rhodomicrobium]